ncbi:MAG: hypothetical protein AB7Q01_14110 [Gammaproteobacteria bacterium]
MALDGMKVRRTRPRSQSFKFDRAKIFDRVKDFYDKDRESRDIDLEQRLQRYAKYRMWTSGSSGVWDGASDIPLPDMTEKSLRLQDTLHNAVMSQRPAINAKAAVPSNMGKERIIDGLLDHQFFVEGRGETVIGDLSDAFINDGVFTCFIPWVKEIRNQSRVKVFPPIPPDAFPSDYFQTILVGMFGQDLIITPQGEEDQPWAFRLSESTMEDEDGNGRVRNILANFYTADTGHVELVIEAEVVIFDGPLPLVKQYDDVFHPPRCANLQPPGPSNPGGAAHVILRDYPTKDEIVRLHKQKFYDKMTREDVEKLTGISRSASDSEERQEIQKDELGGQTSEPKHSDRAPSQDTLTRLIVFDRYDIDGDGLDEDVIWWVIYELQAVVRARVLQEVYPSLRPEHPRPLAEAACFPVQGRRAGFSMLEQLEGIHDAMKTIADQTIDANTMGIIPFGFYRAMSSMQSERIQLAPGELYPLQDPQRDVAFPQIGNPSAQGMAINLMTVLQQFEERVSTVGDLQLGRVPAGKSSALRNASSMNLLAGQGEARPERILRRFFNGLAQVFQVMHDLNQYHLPPAKQFRISGHAAPNENPYIEIQDQDYLAGRYQFSFDANALNTSKQQLQQTLQTLLGTFVNALAIQLGISTPETIYNLLRDYASSLGVNAESKRYLSAPTPGLLGPKIFAEEAMAVILEGGVPSGQPAEAGGYAEHLQKLMELEAMLTDEKIDTGQITLQQAQVFQGYKATVAELAMQQQQQAQLAAAADQFGQQQGAQNPGGRPPTAPPPNATDNPQLAGGAELIDESLPTAGGGGQPA